MNEIGQITTFPVVIKKIIREYDKKLYGPKFGNLEKNRSIPQKLNQTKVNRSSE